MSMNSNTPNRIPGVSVNLGPEPDRSRRVAALKRVADRLHVTMSEMFRMLADGDLSIVITPPGMTIPKQQATGKPGGRAAKPKPESQPLVELIGDEDFRANMATAFASEQVLAREWLTPEEDEAWRDL